MASTKEEKVTSVSAKEVATNILEVMMKQGEFTQACSKEGLSKQEKKEWEQVGKLFRKAVKVKNELNDFGLYNDMVDYLTNLVDIHLGKFVARPLSESELKQLEYLFKEYKKVKDEGSNSIVASVGRHGISVSFRPEEK